MRTSLLIGFGLALAAWLPAVAQDQAPPAAEEPEIELTESLDLTQDRTERMTVPVSIDGRGPYRFIVDTGSERTVISRELAADLGLDAGRTATVYSMTEASRIGTVVIPALEVGRRTVSDIQAPALARRNLGAEGLLGVDSLQSQRVELDFVRQEMSVTPSRREEAPWPADTIVIEARNRYGHLMLVDASLDGERIYVIVDTGSQVTVGNNALRRRLERRGRLSALRPVQLQSVTGGLLTADYGMARRIRLGGAGINNLPIAFADVHPFRQLRLDDRPAILLGMDALQLFDRVSFDFANRRVRLLVGDSTELERELRMAALGAPAVAAAD
ncbi:MAG TPA: retroviral-like aspartic protease family protein [Allosphingosinicella sp.]|jgi:predicted aspartyl protease|nr:retroviral-like aspartic protease family protein [Allosphingosinicella sp.]